MKLRIAMSFLIMIFTSALVLGGLTTAWFTSKSPVSNNPVALIVGEVDVEITRIEPEPFQDHDWIAGEEKDFIWSVKNTGTLPAYFNLHLEEKFSPQEIAWGQGTKLSHNSQGGTYFTYNFQGTERNPFERTLRTTEGHNAGIIKIWEGGDHLHLKVNTHNMWGASQMALAVTPRVDDIPATGSESLGGNPIPAKFPYGEKFSQLTDSYTFKIPLKGVYPRGELEGKSYNLKSSRIFISLQADVYEKEGGSPQGALQWRTMDGRSHNWQKRGEEWIYNQPVQPGESVQFCLTAKGLETGYYQVKVDGKGIQAGN